ncbi:glucuronosyltransferase [Novosphingobium sp. RD2P27]|uniref:Glucuronosyltransferase n=1 Tax=Novosphingobium kalidii TaxID=3230299 RepID=A0ABV2D009_9SPHN
MLLRSTLEQFDVLFATTDPDLAAHEGLNNFRVLKDANRDQPLDCLRCVGQAFAMMREVRPDVVISTGALPGLVCLIVGRLLGARTIWLDSMANSETPSMSGRLARRFSTLWLTQWEHLARPGEYAGSLL